MFFDTLVGDLPKNVYRDRPWGTKQQSEDCRKKFLSQNNKFIIDKDIYNRYLITVSKDGYLKKLNKLKQFQRNEKNKKISYVKNLIIFLDKHIFFNTIKTFLFISKIILLFYWNYF